MRRALRIGLISLALSCAPAALMAQDRATLLSDRLELDGEARLIATGNVEIFYQGRKLTARKLVFDQNADRIAIDGPLLLTERDGRSTILADQADLASDMSEGILTSARIVLEEQMQIASTRLTRSEGRFSEMEDVVASSCQVCAERPVPIWEIRAKRVTHDQLEAMTLADRIVLMNQGRIEQAGTPEEIYSRPATLFAAGFIGTPNMNFFEFEAGEGQLNDGEISLATAQPVKGKVTMGIRPGAVQIVSEGTAGAIIAQAEQDEFHGETRLVTLTSGKQRFLVQVPAATRIKEGERLHIAFPEAERHYFSTETGLRL